MFMNKEISEIYYYNPSDFNQDGRRKLDGTDDGTSGSFQ